MRILLGIDTFALIGGSERYGIQLCEELQLRGHEVGVLCGEFQQEAPRPGQVFLQACYSRERASPEELAALETTIRGFRPDVLFLLTARGRAAVRRMTALGHEFPVVRFVQDHTLFCPGLNKIHADGRNCVEPFGLACLKHYFLAQGCNAFRAELHRSRLDAFGGVWKWKRSLDVARQATCLLVASSYMREELLAVGVAPERVALLPYFTHSASPRAESRAPAAPTLDYVERAGAPLILAPARLTLPEKGIDRLLEALARISRPCRAVIAGTGPAEHALRAEAERLGLGERVHFAGWQDAATLEWLYAHADLVAFPSQWNEPFGLVGIEAMAHALPVVAFDVGGVRDWMAPDTTGRLSPRGDTPGFARHLEELVASPELRARLGKAGRARFEERFTAERHVETLLSLLGKLRPRGA